MITIDLLARAKQSSQQLTAWRLPVRASLGEVPYFSQFESPELIDRFFSGQQQVKNDPYWQASGAQSAEEYVNWAWHMCGLACLKMILADGQGEIYPLVPLAEVAFSYGVYRKEHGQVTDQGLHYYPFATFARDMFDLEVQVRPLLTVFDIERTIADGHYVIASVSPAIFRPQSAPKRRGGHLVLVVGYDRANKTLAYHDPGSRDVNRQQSAEISQSDFERFFAHRGMVVILK